MLRETLIANGHFSLDAYRALLASDGHFALLMGRSLEGELVQVSGRSGDKVKLTVRTPRVSNRLTAATWSRLGALRIPPELVSRRPPSLRGVRVGNYRASVG